MSELLRFPRVIVLQMLISFATVSAVLFTPALPEISQAFHLTAKQTQWPMTIYLLGFAFGPLIYGPLSNQLGRKKALLCGMALAAMGSFITSLAFSFWLFCLGRFIQALGAVAGLKIVFTMVSDLHEGKAAAKVLSFLLFGFSVAPGLGLAIGGLLTSAFGWQSCFIFLAACSLILLVCSFYLPETAKKIHDQPLRWSHVLHGYTCQLKKFSLLLFAMLMGISVSMNYVFATEAPYIGIEVMGLSSKEYGLLGLILPVGVFAGLWLSHQMAGRVSSHLEIASGILACFGGSLLMGLGLFKSWYAAFSLFLPQAIIQMGVTLLWVFAPAKSLSEAVDKSNASAVTQFINMGCATAITFLAGSFLTKGSFLMPAVFVGLVFIMLFIWFFLRKKLNKKSA
jgi:predicted MFS family arabinose efflux permease